MDTRGLGAEISHRAAGMTGAPRPVEKIVAPSPIGPPAEDGYGFAIWDYAPACIGRQIAQPHAAAHRTAANIGRSNDGHEQ
eukprot:5783630-Pyramimonas_sp.AAC.1